MQQRLDEQLQNESFEMNHHHHHHEDEQPHLHYHHHYHDEERHHEFERQIKLQRNHSCPHQSRQSDHRKHFSGILTRSASTATIAEQFERLTSI